MSAKPHSAEVHTTVQHDKEAVEKSVATLCVPEYKKLLVIMKFMELAWTEFQDATNERTNITGSFRTTANRSFGDAFKLQQAEQKRKEAAVKLFVKIGALAKQYEAFEAFVAKECKEQGDNTHVQDVFAQIGSDIVAEAVEAVKPTASH